MAQIALQVLYGLSVTTTQTSPIDDVGDCGSASSSGCTFDKNSSSAAGQCSCFILSSEQTNEHQLAAAAANCTVSTSANDCCSWSTDATHRLQLLVEPIIVDELATLLMTSTIQVVVIDCRTFIAFNTNHVTGAFNAPCGDRFTRKRMQQGRAKVADLVTGGGPNSVQDAKEFYRSLIDSPVAATAVFVAYDDNTVDLKELPPTHPLRLLTESLLNSGHKTKFLKGGFQEFHSSYSALCSRPNESPSRPFLYSPTTPIVELDVDSAPMSQILPYLYIGNKHDAENRQILSSSHITHVLNVTSHIPLYFENDVTVTYLRVPASDSGSQNLKQYFDVAIEFIESVRCAAEGQCILVHCQAGVSRSPTLVLAYIMARYKLSLLDAFAFVKSRRQIIAPNFNFMGQLFDFEQHCRCGEVDLRLQDVDVVRPSDMAAASLAQHF